MTMCSTNGSSSAALLPFGMKLAGQSPYLSLSSPHLGIELQRAQLQEYTQRLQLGLRSFPGQMSSLSHFSYHGHLTNPYLHPYFYKDPRARFIHEEPKPNHSYIGLIAMAILSSREKKLVLSDIYQWILDNYNYFRTRGPGWRNSIRHNLSLNDCFIKAGRSANGKGHYWAIHPANTEDFQKGDFRRRRAQRRVRKHMGLSVPDDDDDDDSPAPSPVTAQAQQALHWDVDKVIDCTKDDQVGTECHSPISEDRNAKLNTSPTCENNGASPAKRPKRLFDMESILAPDNSTEKRSNNDDGNENTQCNTQEDVVANTGNPSDYDTDNTDIKRHAIDLTLSRDIVDNERYIKRPYNGMVLNGNDPVKLPSSHSPVTSGKTLPYIPQLISGIHRGGELQNRVSAFRNAGAYSWASLSGYLSSYQLMALSNQNQTLIQRSVLEGDSGSRWHQPTNNLASQALSTKDQSPQSQSHDE